MGTHIYKYDKLNRVVQGDVAKVVTDYTYDTLGNLVLEKAKNEVVDYQYNILNQLVRKAIKKDVYTFNYDGRGNRLSENGKKASIAFQYDATNHLTEGTNWKGDKSAYTYNGLFARVSNTQTAHSGQVYTQDYVVDYNDFGRGNVMLYLNASMGNKPWSPEVAGTGLQNFAYASAFRSLGLETVGDSIALNSTAVQSGAAHFSGKECVGETKLNTNLYNTLAGPAVSKSSAKASGMEQERNDLMVFSSEYYQQKHVYSARGERIEQFSDRTFQSNGGGGLIRMLYVHEDVLGNTRYYTKWVGQQFCELRYDVWGAPTLSGKLLNNDNGNFARATFTGHVYDTTLDMYHAEARFYDAKYRQFMSADPIKAGYNWYAYVGANPVTWTDPTGLATPSDWASLRYPAEIHNRVSREIISWHSSMKAEQVVAPFPNPFALVAGVLRRIDFVTKALLAYGDIETGEVFGEKEGITTIWELKPESYSIPGTWKYHQHTMQLFYDALLVYQDKLNKGFLELGVAFGGVSDNSGSAISGTFVYTTWDILAVKPRVYAVSYYSVGGGRIYYDFYRLNSNYQEDLDPQLAPNYYPAFDPCDDENKYELQPEFSLPSWWYQPTDDPFWMEDPYGFEEPGDIGGQSDNPFDIPGFPGLPFPVPFVPVF